MYTIKVLGLNSLFLWEDNFSVSNQGILVKKGNSEFSGYELNFKLLETTLDALSLSYNVHEIQLSWSLIMYSLTSHVGVSITEVNMISVVHIYSYYYNYTVNWYSVMIWIIIVILIFFKVIQDGWQISTDRFHCEFLFCSRVYLGVYVSLENALWACEY